MHMDRTISRAPAPTIVHARPVAHPPSRNAGVVAAPAAPAAPMLSFREMGAVAREVGETAVVGAATLAASAISDAIVERTSLSETGRAVAQGVTLGVAGTALMMTGARTVGRGVVVAGIVATGMRVVRAKQWDRIAARWLAQKLGTQRPEERAGSGLWDDPDIRVEAMSEG